MVHAPRDTLRGVGKKAKPGGRNEIGKVKREKVKETAITIVVCGEHEGMNCGTHDTMYGGSDTVTDTSLCKGKRVSVKIMIESDGDLYSPRTLLKHAD